MIGGIAGRNIDLSDDASGKAVIAAAAGDVAVVDAVFDQVDVCAACRADGCNDAACITGSIRGSNGSVVGAVQHSAAQVLGNDAPRIIANGDLSVVDAIFDRTVVFSRNAACILAVFGAGMGDAHFVYTVFNRTVVLIYEGCVIGARCRKCHGTLDRQVLNHAAFIQNFDEGMEITCRIGFGIANTVAVAVERTAVAIGKRGGPFAEVDIRVEHSVGGCVTGNKGGKIFCRRNVHRVRGKGERDAAHQQNEREQQGKRGG